MKNTKMTCLCESCIEAIRSHGERLFVGETIYCNDDEVLICEWCKEENDTLHEVKF